MVIIITSFDICFPTLAFEESSYIYNDLILALVK